MTVYPSYAIARRRARRRVILITLASAGLTAAIAFAAIVLTH